MQQEVRFALVMYGGVSLAVYMNGVAQEFFHLVRATSENASGEATGTEAVYRELAGLVNSRFAVDIISGSSAGGINAIFLGKALANGQDLDGLSRLWMEEADVSRLWNTSLAPRSLLSGDTMYGMMRRALDGMDDGGGSGRMQSEIDVFITSTDIQGLELPLRLSDKTVTEKRHENVFHFLFAEDKRDDFAREANPFLAFAARASSSFPIAFEPARLVDYGPVPEAARFFPDYVAASADYARRAFGDGGYLNNKPFNYALGQIPRRISDLKVRRMLVYVEPAPEQAGGNLTQAAPGPIRNSIEALITLHHYETIRGDLRQALDRNRLVERVREVTAQVDQDVESWRNGGLRPVPRLTGSDYARRTLSEEIHARGPGYAGYHRLKVRAVVDELARLARLPRQAVDQWRARNYREEDAASSENLFLLHFDLGYRQRRLRFLLMRMDESGGHPELRRELSRIAKTLETVSTAPRDSGDIEGVTSAIRTAFREVMIPAAEQVERCLAGHPAKRRFGHYFEDYEEYDQVTFPIYYETQVGETEPVEVFRISPLDARSLIDESSPSERRRKLAGTALFHFGAFLKRSWRANDMLWGRLDGAERIIAAVLPAGSSEARRLAREAHLAVLRESFGDEAEVMYRCLQSAYEVDRRLGLFRAAGVLARLSWIGLKMLLSL